MSVRAKMKVDEKAETTYGYRLKLTAVYGDNPENKAFFKATPSASIEMATINKDAADQFEVGKEYYVDFTSAA